MDHSDNVMQSQFYPVRARLVPAGARFLMDTPVRSLMSCGDPRSRQVFMADPGSDSSASFDYDYVIIGSGSGGSVCALRLTEKGELRRVHVGTVGHRQQGFLAEWFGFG